ncbi:AAA-domain-containing protein [Conidiobolus coronatus NRRL 28638]|uniref:AAA-domain-containing protein n=1 Tax=Conidiobolus coronatus (strain ATCC 28846 / CBS 209.66 / NRRL 28638) TaxID=796925 RepID=A0A137PAD9_CONC2|nr:AAA-domain-containing protein [Conidiobolus coronatus NRRL 28638]|eukprot:KXN71983.1 AAA-domain-containing protein [Conidiobolus coronatus NRRL 28638]
MDVDDIYNKLGLFNTDSKLEIDEFEVKKEIKEEDEVDPFTKVGGLKEQLELVKRVVDIPLNKPETFTNYNLKPPRGLLLFGPPGTGKSLLAQAAAKHSKATLFTVNGPELVSKFVGETEAKIREIFEKARDKEPSIILIDEIDSICPNRDDAQNELDKRVVATFLTLLDGASSDEHGKFHRIVVIGTTNRVQSIDPALRRPGRFDIEVEIGIPSPEDRYDILKTLLNSVNHNLTDDFVKSISDKSHGYVGADLSAVVKEAGLSAIQRKIKNPTEEDLIISESDIIETIGKIKPSAMREVSVKVPKVLWSDIGGHHHVRHKLKESVEWPLKHPEVFTRFNIKPPKGILLYVKGPELFNKWVGESEKAVKEVFRKARAAAPSIVFFDEMDALTVKRGNDGDTSSVADRVLSQILTEMDGLDSLVNVTVVGATNRPDIMDPALLRPGRMDRILYIGPPNYEARLEIFNIQSKKMPFSDDINIEYLSEKTEGCSGAEVVALCQEAAMNSLQRDLNTKIITFNDFELALQKLIKRITPEMLEFYHNYASTSGMKQV